MKLELIPGSPVDVAALALPHQEVQPGRATVEIHGDGGASMVALSPGTLMHLNAGIRTTWIVHERLRKVYLSP